MAYLERVIADQLRVRVAYDTDMIFRGRAGDFDTIAAVHDTLAQSRELMARAEAMLASSGVFIQEYRKSVK